VHVSVFRIVWIPKICVFVYSWQGCGSGMIFFGSGFWSYFLAGTYQALWIRNTDLHSTNVFDFWTFLWTLLKPQYAWFWFTILTKIALTFLMLKYFIFAHICSNWFVIVVMSQRSGENQQSIVKIFIISFHTGVLPCSRQESEFELQPS
jgi:hypothetical protein